MRIRIFVLTLIALTTLGNDSCTGNSKGRDNLQVCQTLNYPFCDEVPNTYPCLCLSRAAGVTREEAELLRYVY